MFGFITYTNQKSNFQEYAKPCQTVKVKVDKKFYEQVTAKLPFLCYNSLEAFACDAGQLRLENLMQLAAKT